MMRQLLATTALSLTLAPGAIRADDSDVGLWLEAGASYELGAHLKVQGAQMLRFDRDVSRVSSTIPEATLSFEPWDFFDLGAGYRYEHERSLDDEEFKGRHRLQADAELSSRIDRMTPSYRVRIQDHVEDDFKSPTIRHRLELEWRRRGRWRPAASGELFYDLDHGEMKKIRGTLGVKIATDDVETDVFYRMDFPRDAMDPTVFIIGLAVEAEL